MSVDPQIADRLAKLLRLACCETAPDGERVAAINRLSATVVANEIDWDSALTNGGPTRDQMQQLFDAGYERGLADGRAETQRDWTPAVGTSAPVGTNASRIKAIVEAADYAISMNLLSDWETTFLTDIAARFNRYGPRTYVSQKQWGVLDRIEANMRSCEVL